MKKRLEELREERRKLKEEAEAIIKAADEAGKDITPEEHARIDEIAAKMDTLTAQIAARERAAKIVETDLSNAGTGFTPAQPRTEAPENTAALLSKKMSRFKSFGEFACMVRSAARGMAPQELMDWIHSPYAATFGNEAVGAEGGYWVPPEFYPNILGVRPGVVNLLNMCFGLPISGNAIDIPVDTDLPWGTAVMNPKKQKPGVAITPSKAIDLSKPISLKLNDTVILISVNNDLLQDAPALEAYLTKKGQDKIVNRINREIIRGTGAAAALGILNAPALITVAKESNQAADTIVLANVLKMWARLYADFRPNSVWFFNQDAEPQLDTLNLGNFPLMMPNMTLQGSGFSTIKGRPAIPLTACSTVGDVGDIILADLTQYIVAYKNSGIETAMSIHLLFDEAKTAFRFIFRFDGEPWLPAPMTPENGSNTLSAFITLAERASA